MLGSTSGQKAMLPATIAPPMSCADPSTACSPAAAVPGEHLDLSCSPGRCTEWIVWMYVQAGLGRCSCFVDTGRAGGERRKRGKKISSETVGADVDDALSYEYALLTVMRCFERGYHAGGRSRTHRDNLPSTTHVTLPAIQPFPSSRHTAEHTNVTSPLAVRRGRADGPNTQRTTDAPAPPR